jgi:hypothetical protein
MGRYAFFNTGLEYKFTFALQKSSDILKFGGMPDSKEYSHRWSRNDQTMILGRVRDMEDVLGLPEMKFELYEKTLDGTHTLRHDLWDIVVADAELFSTYSLGCLIYHQLLYTEGLTCRYEV